MSVVIRGTTVFDWSTGYKEGKSKIFLQGLGLKRSGVQDQGTLGGVEKATMVSPKKGIRMESGKMN